MASLALALLVIFSGTLATYLYDDDAPFQARLCSGACLGITALSLLGFVFSSLLGLTGTTVLLSALVCSLPLALLAKETYSVQFQKDLSGVSQTIRRLTSKPDAVSIGYVVFYVVTALVLWQVFSKAMIQDSEGVSTGLLNNFGDLPFHLSVITGFAYGNNFPPEDPTYAGVRFTYPFLSDFASAMFVRTGSDLRESMFIENFILAISFVGLLHRWALVMLRDRLAAILTPLLVLLNGGFGWLLLFDKANSDDNGLLGLFSNLPPSFAVIVFTQWWLAENPQPSGETEGKKTDLRRSRRAKVHAQEVQSESSFLS